MIQSHLTSIIIPSFNGVALLKQCISSIKQYTEEPYEVIVVDNGSTDKTFDYCASQKIRFISLPENRGFPAACNAGLRLARGDSLLLLNNDVTVTRGWLTLLKQGLYSDPSIGIVGPVTNYASGIQQIPVEFHSMEQFQQIAAVHNQADPEKWKEVNRIVGLCFLFKREVLEQIGELDEIFSPGHYEDDDYCYRARLAGYLLLVMGDVLVHHEGSASFKKENTEALQQLIRRNRILYMQKWKVDPLQFIE
ncbi:glycosyltransferase family 2 protein [Paenibacillus sp. Marseille-Q4541]|uniref:glycosyltransferase family 2 protein n=1 Tax=Paenibacillus sp. Marseille-Q4541 TaxID=2831522 RepID=UPI001BAD7E35|nr:glycosyltransferase family 2 protein [Paenibacillus sp. Marseille-Q4541]